MMDRCYTFRWFVFDCTVARWHPVRDEERVQINVIDTKRPVARRFFEWCGERIPGMVGGALDYGGRFRVSSNSFFQVNRFLAEQLVEAALAGAEGEAALDLYAGVGLFSLALGRRFRRVNAVESGGGAVRDLRFNAERAGLAGVKAEQTTAEAALEKLQRAPDFVLADPPRSGLGKTMVERLAALKPRRLTIVACDPATLARDLAALTASGYRVASMTLVDLFRRRFIWKPWCGWRSGRRTRGRVGQLSRTGNY